LSTPHLELVQRPQSGMYHMLTENCREDLRRMYLLFMREGVVLKEQPMATVFERFVRDMGTAILDARRSEVQRLEAEGKKEPSSDTRMIVSLLELYADCEEKVKSLFGRNIAFQKAMKNAFQVVVNTNATKKYTNVELLVAYCDTVLKGKENSEKLDEQRMEERLDGALNLFRFIVNKDLFAELYRGSLAKRLLTNKSTSMEMEKAMITKMKQAQGTTYTRNIEGMVRDHQMIADGVKEFDAYLQKAGGLGIRAKPVVQVLTRGYWPSQTRVNVDLHGCFGDIISAYEEFFEDKHGGNKILQWIPVLGNAEVTGVFPKGKFTIVVTTLQAMALVKVGEEGALTTTQVCDLLRTDMEVAKRIMHSLSCGKYKVLTKSGPGGKNKVHEQDQFSPNFAFSTKVKRFQIPMASLDNVDQVKQRVKEDRGVAIDAALVRTMKARNILKHQDLIAEVIAQLNQFKPEVSQVKKCIEGLIGREYLARCEDSTGSWTKEYKYLA